VIKIENRNILPVTDLDPQVLKALTKRYGSTNKEVLVYWTDELKNYATYYIVVAVIGSEGYRKSIDCLRMFGYKGEELNVSIDNTADIIEVNHSLISQD